MNGECKKGNNEVQYAMDRVLSKYYQQRKQDGKKCNKVKYTHKALKQKYL